MSGAGPSADFEPPWPADALEVGRVTGAWGVKGWIRVQPFSADAQALFAARRWFVKPPEESIPRRLPPTLAIGEVRRHGDSIIALPVGSADRSAAEALQGARIFVGRSEFPATGQDEYYWADLLGLEVVNRQGQVLGTVVGLLDTGPHSVLRVQSQSEGSEAVAERLIPFVAAYVDDVSLAERRVSVDWGLDF